MLREVMTSDRNQNQLPPEAVPSPGEDHHNFDAQKEIHQRIRNDPDYDDWEYGTEPLPHEAWVAHQQPTLDGAVRTG